MAFEDLEEHLAELGIAPLDDEFASIDPRTWQSIEARAGGAFPAVVRWLFTRYGGFSFEHGAYYPDKHADTEAMFGWFVGGAELADSFESTRESMPRDVVPIANDGGDNFVCVGVGDGNRGQVSFYLHDAPDGQQLYPLAKSVEDFLHSLHRGTDTVDDSDAPD